MVSFRSTPVLFRCQHHLLSRLSLHQLCCDGAYNLRCQYPWDARRILYFCFAGPPILQGQKDEQNPPPGLDAMVVDRGISCCYAHLCHTHRTPRIESPIRNPHQ